MVRMLGVIDCTTQFDSLSELTVNRSLGAIPFAGRFRLVDFVLSSMVNSGIESVGLFLKHRYRSLMDHIETGKNWDLNRKSSGVYYFPPYNAFSGEEHEMITFEELEDHMPFFKRSRPKYAVVTNSHTVCNIDFDEALEQHLEQENDITVFYNGTKQLNMFILSKELLMDLINERSQTGFIHLLDVIRSDEHAFKIGTFQVIGYVAVIDSMSTYFASSLEILQPEKWEQLFIEERPILTKVKDEPPTRYARGSVVKNCAIANGCELNGKIENTIISRGVKVGRRSEIKDSVIMQKSNIGNNCILEHVILDKGVHVEDNVKLVGTLEHPIIVKKGTIQGALISS